MKRKLALWFDPFDRWFWSFVIFVIGALMTVIMFRKIPIRMKNGRLSFFEIIEVIIAFIPLLVLIVKLIKCIGNEKKDFDQYYSLSDFDKQVVQYGVYEREVSRRIRVHRLRSVVKGILAIVISVVVWNGILTLITRYAELLIIALFVVLIVLNMVIKIKEEGFGKVLSDIGDSVLDSVSDILSDPWEENEFLSTVIPRPYRYEEIDSEHGNIYIGGEKVLVHRIQNGDEDIYEEMGSIEPRHWSSSH